MSMASCLLLVTVFSDSNKPLTLDWNENILTVSGPAIPTGSISIRYIEAYCRPNSHETDWTEHTVIGHHTEMLSRSFDHSRLYMRCTLDDGVVVDHFITAGADQVDFRVTAHNPTGRASLAHWAQPCVRVGDFTGFGEADTADAYAYIQRCFIFLDEDLARMPTKDWATQARYTPGQVWRAPGVSAADVNPRPLNPHVPTLGLIGCYATDEKTVLATAWEPYQELFQGVIRCIHADFRIGGLDPGETKYIRGKLYIVPADIPRLIARYRRDFEDRP